MSEIQANPEAETHQLFRQRWSPRAFNAKRDVSRQTLLSCLEAARWAPSCFGEQPWRFIVCQRSENEAAWARMLACLVPKNREWAQHAPVLLLVCASGLFSHNDAANRWSGYDTGAAGVSLCLQAAALGLQAHQMGGFDTKRVAGEFHLPESFTPMAVLALGYEGEVGQLEQSLHSMELAARKRKPLSEVLCFHDWHNGEQEG